MKNNPKITIEVIDNKWVVTRSAFQIGAKVFEKETKIFILWHQVEGYLKEYLTH